MNQMALEGAIKAMRTLGIRGLNEDADCPLQVICKDVQAHFSVHSFGDPSVARIESAMFAVP